MKGDALFLLLYDSHTILPKQGQRYRAMFTVAQDGTCGLPGTFVSKPTKQSEQHTSQVA